MNHLIQFKIFEDVNNYLENYFKDKINWKLIQTIQEFATEYEDAGYLVTIIIYSIKPQDDCLARIWTSSRGYTKTDGELLSLTDLVYLYKKYNMLYYRIAVSSQNSVDEPNKQITTEEFDKFILIRNKIIERVKTKFDINIIETEIYNGVFILDN